MGTGMRYILTLTVVVAFTALCACCCCAADPAEELRRSESLILAGDCEAALAVLRGVTDPEYLPRALRTMANCYRRMSKWDEAISCYEKILSLPDSTLPALDVHMSLMDCHLARGDAEEGLSMLKRLSAKFPHDTWRLHYVVGRRYFWQHRYSQAISELKQAVGLGAGRGEHPDFTDARSYLVNSYIGAKQWDLALGLTHDLMRDCQSRAWEWSYARGRCYQGQGQYKTAAAELEKAYEARKEARSEETRQIGKALLESYISACDLSGAETLAARLEKDYPDSTASWHYALGRVYMTQGAYEEAASHFDRTAQASKLRWEVRSAMIYRGECLYEIGRGKEALPAVRGYYAGKPDWRADGLLIEGAILYHGAKDYDGAIVVLRQLISEYESKKDASAVALVDTARELIVEALEGGGRWSEAAAFLESIASGRPDEGVLRYRSGENYFRDAKYREALRAYRRAMDCPRLGSSIRARAMYQQALCYKQQGFHNSAERLAARVCDLYPDSDAAMDARGSLYVWHGMPESDTAGGQ